MSYRPQLHSLMKDISILNIYYITKAVLCNSKKCKTPKHFPSAFNHGSARTSRKLCLLLSVYLPTHCIGHCNFQYKITIMLSWTFRPFNMDTTYKSNTQTLWKQCIKKNKTKQKTAVRSKVSLASSCCNIYLHFNTTDQWKLNSKNELAIA